jgi:hypothetical protein
LSINLLEEHGAKDNWLWVLFSTIQLLNCNLAHRVAIVIAESRIESEGWERNQDVW